MSQSSFVTGMAQRNNMAQLLDNTQNFIKQKWTTSAGKDITTQRNKDIMGQPKQMRLKPEGVIDIMA